MFDPEEIPELKASVKECAISDKKLLDDLLKEVMLIKSNVKVIQPYSVTSISLVASDGGNNKLVFDPFYFQLVRVVDSNGCKLCLDTVSPTTDTDILSMKQFEADKNPKTALGYLMRDLKCETLNDLSPMIPKGSTVRNEPEKISQSWVLRYRDLCEWAVLYFKICYTRFATNTLIVRDGLLRTKSFRGNLFEEMGKKIELAIAKAQQQDRIKIFLVGLAKHSAVLTRYSLAMQIEDIFPKGEARYASIPREIEEKSYSWKEIIRKTDEELMMGGEGNKFNIGNPYIVRFGKMTGDPVWAVDVFHSQINFESQIFGYLLADAINGFPVPFYPLCLQKAHEHAQIVDFDMDILQLAVTDALRNLLPDHKKNIVDEQVFNTDKSLNRYA